MPNDFFSTVAHAFPFNRPSCSSGCRPPPKPPSPSCSKPPCKPPDPPCPPECKPCPPPCPPCSFAYLTQSGMLEVCRRSGEIPFCGECRLGEGFTRDGGRLQIHKPGVYQAIYTLNLPALKPLDTVFSLQADGRNLPGFILRVCRPPGNGSASFTAQGVWETDCPCTLRLASSRAFKLDSPGPSDTLASLSVIRLTR